MVAELLGAWSLIALVVVVALCASRKKKRDHRPVTEPEAAGPANYPVVDLRSNIPSSKQVLGPAARAEWSDMELPPMSFELLGVLKKTNQADYFKCTLNVRSMHE